MTALRMIPYLGWLVGQVVVGSLAVTADLFRRTTKVAPRIVKVPLRCSTNAQLSIFASSITMTPGTQVVAVGPAMEHEPRALFVHVLFGRDEEAALAGLRDMETRVMAATRGKEGS